MRNQAAAFCDSEDATDSALLILAKQRNPSAWERIVDQYSALVYHWCRRSGLGPEDAADVLQSVMLKLAQYLPQFEKDGRPAAFRRWLSTVTRTCITDLVRAAQSQPHGLGGTDALLRLNTLESPCETGSSIAAAAESKLTVLFDVLEEVEQSVEPTTWNAFRLTVFENLTSTEAALRLNMSPAAIRLAKARVLQRLRGRLESGDSPFNGRAI
jgi:RNA polymerase sigma-70 factor (ECF subfamily)